MGSEERSVVKVWRDGLFRRHCPFHRSPRSRAALRRREGEAACEAELPGEGARRERGRYEAALSLSRSFLCTLLYLQVYFQTDVNLWAALRHARNRTPPALPPPDFTVRCVRRPVPLLNSLICSHTHTQMLDVLPIQHAHTQSLTFWPSE